MAHNPDICILGSIEGGAVIEADMPSNLSHAPRKQFLTLTPFQTRKLLKLLAAEFEKRPKVGADAV